MSLQFNEPCYIIKTVKKLFSNKFLNYTELLPNWQIMNNFHCKIIYQEDYAKFN